MLYYLNLFMSKRYGFYAREFVYNKKLKQLFKKYFEIYFILINEILIMLNIIQRIFEKQNNKGNSKVFMVLRSRIIFWKLTINSSFIVLMNAILLIMDSILFQFYLLKKLKWRKFNGFLFYSPTNPVNFYCFIFNK